MMYSGLFSQIQLLKPRLGRSLQFQLPLLHPYFLFSTLCFFCTHRRTVWWCFFFSLSPPPLPPTSPSPHNVAARPGKLSARKVSLENKLRPLSGFFPLTAGSGGSCAQQEMLFCCTDNNKLLVVYPFITPFPIRLTKREAENGSDL